MKITIADYLVKKMNELGIKEIFGLPGDFNFKIVEAIERNKDVNWIGSTNELNAGYAADGYARMKGFGALVTTYGVGELSAMNAIAGSMAENIPVIKITGVPLTKHIKNRTLLHHNLDNADYYAFSRAYSNIVETTAYLTEENAKKEIDRIINIMVKTRKPVYVAIPIDVCDVEIECDCDKTIEFPKSNPKNLNIAADEIIKEIEKSKNPVLIAGILSYRFEAKEALNKFLLKSRIPSCAFVRGMDIVQPDVENYLGVYIGNNANIPCYNYVNSSDCVILAGTVISDLNTSNFDFKFKVEDSINIHPDFVEIKGRKIEDVLIKDLFETLEVKINHKFIQNLKGDFGYNEPQGAKDEPLNMKYLYPRLSKFLKENDILITEVGLVPFGAIPMKFPKNVNVQNQMLWGSIGWATPCAFGCAISDRNRRTILVTGDGSHQLTAQEISTMMRNDVHPIVFVINNSGYTVERILCDDVHYKYNEIASWNYSMLPKVFKGECFTAKVETIGEFDEILKQVEIEQKTKMCYIELVTDYLDIPPLAMSIAKHPEQLKR